MLRIRPQVYRFLVAKGIIPPAGGRVTPPGKPVIPSWRLLLRGLGSHYAPGENRTLSEDLIWT